MVLLTDGRSGKVNMFHFHVIVVTVLKDRQNESAWKMDPGQELNLRVVRDTKSFNYLIDNKQTWEGTANNCMSWVPDLSQVITFIKTMMSSLAKSAINKLTSSFFMRLSSYWW